MFYHHMLGKKKKIGDLTIRPLVDRDQLLFGRFVSKCFILHLSILSFDFFYFMINEVHSSNVSKDDLSIKIKKFQLI